MQHADSILSVHRFVQDLVIHDYHCVGAEHVRMRLMARYLQSLFFRKPFSAGASALARERGFIHIGRLGGEWNSRVAQQFLAAGGGGCEHEHGFQIVSGTPS